MRGANAPFRVGTDTGTAVALVRWAVGRRVPTWLVRRVAHRLATLTPLGWMLVLLTLIASRRKQVQPGSVPERLALGLAANGYPLAGIARCLGVETVTAWETLLAARRVRGLPEPCTIGRVALAGDEPDTSWQAHVATCPTCRGVREAWQRDDVRLRAEIAQTVGSGSDHPDPRVRLRWRIAWLLFLLCLPALGTVGRLPEHGQQKGASSAGAPGSSWVLMVADDGSVAAQDVTTGSWRELLPATGLAQTEVFLSPDRQRLARVAWNWPGLAPALVRLEVLDLRSAEIVQVQTRFRDDLAIDYPIGWLDARRFLFVRAESPGSAEEREGDRWLATIEAVDVLTSGMYPLGRFALQHVLVPWPGTIVVTEEGPTGRAVQVIGGAEDGAVSAQTMPPGTPGETLLGLCMLDDGQWLILWHSDSGEARLVAFEEEEVLLWHGTGAIELFCDRVHAPVLVTRAPGQTVLWRVGRSGVRVLWTLPHELEPLAIEWTPEGRPEFLLVGRGRDLFRPPLMGDARWGPSLPETTVLYRSSEGRLEPLLAVSGRWRFVGHVSEVARSVPPVGALESVLREYGAGGEPYLPAPQGGVLVHRDPAEDAFVVRDLVEGRTHALPSGLGELAWLPSGEALITVGPPAGAGTRVREAADGPTRVVLYLDPEGVLGRRVPERLGRIDLDPLDFGLDPERRYLAVAPSPTGIALALLTCDRARGVVELWFERVDRVSPEWRASWKTRDCAVAQDGSVLVWVSPTRLVVMIPVMRASEGPVELLVQSFGVDGAAARELARHRVRGAERAIVPVEVASDGITLVYRLRVEGADTGDRVVALDLAEGSPLVLAEGEPARGLCLRHAGRGVVVRLGQTVAWYGWNGRVRSLVDAAQVVACLPDGRVLVLVEEGDAGRPVLLDPSA
ncbi:hypothetical protein OO015_04000 [Thermomicrobium sp. 4228-Ro]|uniref:hypothetical protein n=1 Tax=Thermomicrobium sp. 4228-Ro TaxID=2993937 RepID=UPI0022489464|nr:hypothetical protein [Thermomicrobium sp. 4228-Ro]MCX2726654.1 hypothetical protein [Thermomicrobium sp. 4228-Ro]